MSRGPIPSWLTKVPLISTQSKLGGMSVLSLQWRKTGLFDSVRPCKRARSRPMHKKAAMLEDRGVLSVSGADATSFLQGLLTNDVERLQQSEARYAALLTPQGKILFDMIVVRALNGDEPSYLIDCAAAQVPDLAKRLGFYKLR